MSGTVSDYSGDSSAQLSDYSGDLKAQASDYSGDMPTKLSDNSGDHQVTLSDNSGVSEVKTLSCTGMRCLSDDDHSLYFYNLFSKEQTSISKRRSPVRAGDSHSDTGTPPVAHRESK